MMVNDSRKNQDPNRTCKALIDAGIDDPSSQEGKDFCVDKCPYSRCVAYEPKRGRPSNTSTIYASKEAWVASLDHQGYSIMEIALSTGISVRTVERMLRARMDKQDQTEG